jgi:hypothetical protein
MEDNSLEALTSLRKKFQAHEPLTFTADINTATEVKKVVIDDLRVTEVAGRPQQYTYVMRLEEYIPPPPPASAQPSLASDAENLMDGILDTLGDLPDLSALDLDLVNPLPPMSTLVDGVSSTAGQMASALGTLNDLFG